MPKRPSDSRNAGSRASGTLRPRGPSGNRGAAEDHLAFLIEHVEEYAIFTLDAEGFVTRWSGGAERLTGYGAGEIEGRHFSVLYPEAEVRNGLPERALRTAAEEQRFGEERWCVRKDGTVFWANEILLPLRDDERRLTGFGVILRDLTDRRRAEEERARLLDRERAARAEAEEAARRMKFLADVSSVLASSLDSRATLACMADLSVPGLADWCVVYVLDEGGQIRRIAGAHADPAKEPWIRAFVDAPVDPDAEPQVTQALRTGEPIVIPEVPEETLEALQREGGPEYRRILSALGADSTMVVPIVAREKTLGALVFVSAGSGRRYDADRLALAQEVARRAGLALDNARLYEAAQAASRAKSDFLAVMSHELRTPLSAIIGYAELLEEGIIGALTPEQQQQVRRIEASAWHLLELIEEILVYSRLEADRERVRVERVDLAELVRDLTPIIEPSAAAKDLDFHVRLPERPVVIETDPAKVRRILLDLLTNAVKFTYRGEVRLELEPENGWVVFRVTDTGIGIAPEHLERIFEAFSQEQEALTRQAGGTGLGLTVARRLARLLGGDVTVTSAPGKGSTFTVRIPTRTEPRAHAA